VPNHEPRRSIRNAPVALRSPHSQFGTPERRFLAPPAWNMGRGAFWNCAHELTVFKGLGAGPGLVMLPPASNHVRSASGLPSMARIPIPSPQFRITRSDCWHSESRLMLGGHWWQVNEERPRVNEERGIAFGRGKIPTPPENWRVSEAETKRRARDHLAVTQLSAMAKPVYNAPVFEAIRQWKSRLIPFSSPRPGTKQSCARITHE